MLIIDMPMPKFCIWCDDKNEPRRCPLLNEDDNCVLQDSNIWMGWNEQYAHCPIKGVLPEEHGDLIDRDALFLKYREQYDFIDEEDILNAKAVIAAEGKDDENH